MRKFLAIPTKLHYGLVLVSYLAGFFKSGEFVSLEEVSKKTRISQGYLEEIASLLKNKELISGKRGLKGGYKFNKDPREISISEIVEAIEGPILLVDCLKNKTSCCSLEKEFFKECSSKILWALLQKDIVKMIKHTKLSSLI